MYVCCLRLDYNSCDESIYLLNLRQNPPMKVLRRHLMLSGLVIALVSCAGDGIDVEHAEEDNELLIVQDRVLDSADAINTSLNGMMFSIPSPIQMASLLKSKVGVFNASILTDPEKVGSFTTEFKRAINLGIYGADLGYSTIYESNTKAVSYLSSIETLSDELGISGAFDQALLERFIENGSNQDSMLVIMSEGYRKGDQFLKENDDHDIATLVLVGGWIESLYFAGVSYEDTKSQEIADRIGEQKTALKTIISLLEEFNKDGEYATLLADLNELRKYFLQIEFNYTYLPPVVDVKNKETTFKSKSFVKIQGGVLNKIIAKVKAIRNGLIV